MEAEHCLLHDHGLGALHSAGRRRHGKPAAAHPAPPAHAQTPLPRGMAALGQAAFHAEAASPPQERRAGGVRSPGQARADWRRTSARIAGGQVSISGPHAVAPAAAPDAAAACAQPLAAQPGMQRSYRPPSMEAWLPAQGLGRGEGEQGWLAFVQGPPEHEADERAPDWASHRRAPPPGFAAPPSDWAPAASRGQPQVQGQGQRPTSAPQLNAQTFTFARAPPCAAPTARLGGMLPYSPDLTSVPSPEGADAEDTLAQMAALLPGFPVAAPPLPLQPDQAFSLGDGGPAALLAHYGPMQRTTANSDASPKIAALQGGAQPEEALRPRSAAVHSSMAATHARHLPTPIDLPEEAGADGAAACGAHNGVQLAATIMVPDDVAAGEANTAWVDSLPPRFRGRIQGLPAAGEHADTTDAAWGGEVPQGSQLGFETWGPEMCDKRGRRAVPMRQYRPPLVLGRMVSHAMAAAMMDRGTRRQEGNGSPKGSG